MDPQPLSVQLPSYPPDVRYDVLVVGGGTAGCVLAARLSENPDRRVCLIEAGPDFGPLADGRWPPELLDFRALPSTHDWGRGGQDRRSLGGRVLGGSSAVNACAVVEGTPADYDEWGGAWSYEQFRPYLQRARLTLRTTSRNTESPGLFHEAFVAAALARGLPELADLDDSEEPVGVAPFPANVFDGVRWNAAAAYLDDCRARPNLAILPDTLVDRVVLEGTRAAAVLDANGRSHHAEVIVLAAGAYFSPAILLRSGIGPASELHGLGIAPACDLPVGRRLLDHCGTSVTWSLSAELRRDAAARARTGDLVQPHAIIKGASTHCPPGAWDLHLLSWISPSDESDAFEASALVFHLKPLSHGRVLLRSRDPHEPPLVERGFLSHADDVDPVLEGIDLARRLAATEPLAALLDAELRPGALEPEEYVRTTVRNYFHPAGTCALGSVVDDDGRVLGVDGLVVADASVMPTIPRANTNLTTAAIAERLSEVL